MVSKADGMRNDILMPEAVRSYLKQHKLDEIVVAALNSTAKVMPDDPFGHIAVLLAKNCSSAPSFVKLEYDPLEAGDLRFHVVVSIRGVHVRAHALSFADVLFDEPPVDEGEEQVRRGSKGSADSGAEAAFDPLMEQVQAAQREAQMVGFLEGFFKTAFENVFVDDLVSFADRCEGFSEAPLPGSGFIVNMPRATAFLTNELITTSAHCLSISGLELFQRALVGADLAEYVAPPLKSAEDLAAWRAQSTWPRVAMPLFHGGGPSVLRVATLRFCAAFTPFAIPPASEASGFEAAPPDCPALGCFAKVCQIARDARQEAVKALQADKALASLVVEGIAYCHPEGLLQTARLAQKAAEAAAGEQSASETSGVLIACAAEAWVAEEDAYEFETGKKLTLEQLVDLYAEIAEEGWLRMLIQPFRQEDISAGCELLHARAPGLRLVTDLTGPVHKSKLKGEAYSCPFRPSGTVSAALTQYGELANLWSEAEGCGRCTFLDPSVASSMPPLIYMLLALRDTEVVMLPSEIADEDLAQMSSCMDDVLSHLLYPDEVVDV